MRRLGFSDSGGSTPTAPPIQKRSIPNGMGRFHFEERMMGRALFVTLAVLMFAGVIVAPRPAYPQAAPARFRLLPLGPSGQTVQGNIAVTDGVAGVRVDGSGAAVCVSFKNTDSRVAVRVMFDFPLLGFAGLELTHLTLDRKGTFSPNIVIETNVDASDIDVFTPGNFPDNCADDEEAAGTTQFTSAWSAGYRVVRVDYADGTTWTPTP